MASGPQRFGPFTVTGELGRGGQGAVLRAVDPAGRAVALKLLLRADARHVRRFRQEAQVLAALEHPGIVRVLDAGVEGGVPWLAMALVEGESLRARLDREGPLPPLEAARLVAALARALGHCHARGVVHRDLKPENVLVERATGRPVLVDFGLIRRDAEVFGALSIDDRSRLSVTGELRGTPAFMAPEQVNPGKFGPVSPATDVYGLGGVLCALLTGEPPHLAGSLPALMVSILEGNVPDVAGRRPGLPPALVDACRRALAPVPADRFPSADALADALDAVVVGRAPAAPRGAPRVAVAAAVVVVVAGMVGAAVAVARRPEPSPSGPAPGPAPGAPSGPAPGAPAGPAPGAPAGLEPSPAPSPAPAEVDPEEAKAARRRPPRLVWTGRHGGAVLAAVFRPGAGDELASGGDSDGAVRLWRVGADAPTRVLTPGGHVKVLAFTPDGRQLLSERGRALCG